MTPNRKSLTAFPIIALLAFAAPACDDDNGKLPGDPDAAVDGAVGGQGGTGGTQASDAGPLPDSASGGSPGDAALPGDAGSGTGGAAPVVNQMAALIRFNADGTPDNTFGTNGVTRLDRNAMASTALGWDVQKNAAGELFVFGHETASGRSDLDRYVAKLNANGVLDTTWGETVNAAKTGYQTLNIANLTDNVRAGYVDSMGRPVTFGYASSPTGVGTMAANALVIARLNTDGSYDTTFGVGGVFNYNPFNKPFPMQWGMGEAYGGFEQTEGANAGKYVTCGYGRSAASGQVNVVAFRLTPTGGFDTTWGTNGIVELDWDDNFTSAGTNDRCRNLTRLPNDRTLIVGSYESPAMKVNPMVLVLGENGALDTTFGTGGYRRSMGSVAARTDESYHGTALSPDKNTAAAVGYSAGGTGLNDDSRILLLPMGAGTAIEKEIKLSETLNDRLVTAAYDAQNRLVAAGFIAVDGGDTAFVVARFTATGDLDTTFGTGGIASRNIAVGKGTAETARGIVIQNDGKIVLVGNLQE